MKQNSLLAYAGLYRVELSEDSTEDCPRVNFRPIHELTSNRYRISGKSFLEEHLALQSVLNSFAGNFMTTEQQMRDALAQHDRLKARRRNECKEDFTCSVTSKINVKEYPMTVSTGEFFDKKVALPVSPHGIFIKVPTQGYVQFCQRKSQSATEDDLSKIAAPFPYTDEVMYSFEISNEQPAMEGHLCGFGLILNSHVFTDPTENGEHIALCMLSSSPDFLFVKQLVVNTATVLHATASENRFKSQSSKLDPLLKKGMMELTALVENDSDCSKVFPFRKVELPFFSSNPFTELRRSGVLCYQMIDTPLSTLLLSFNYDGIRQLHTLLLQERRIVFVGCTAQHASACAVSAPSLVAPLKWVAPLVPYLHAREAHASFILDVLFSPPVRGLRSLNLNVEEDFFSSSSESNGFIVGTTGELIPPLLLRWSALAASHGCSSHATDIWIADARTGNVGLLPLEQPPCTSNLSPKLGPVISMEKSSIALLPVSDKLQNSYNAAVKDTLRALFRGVVSYFSYFRKALIKLEAHNAFVQRLLTEGENSDMYFDKSNRFDDEWYNDAAAAVFSCPNIGESMLAEIHAAFLEYNTHRVCGEYRKGISKSLSELKLKPYAYLVARLHSQELTKNIIQTHMFMQFTRALLWIERLGVKKVLEGNSASNQKETQSLHPWLRSPAVLADLCHFFSRARNRFPEIYPDLSGAVLPQWCLLQANNALQLSEREDPKDVKWKASGIFPTIVSLSGTASDGTNESKGSVLKFFSKASKAVKKLQNGEQQYIATPPFIQAFNSFGVSNTAEPIASAMTVLKVEFQLPELLGEKPPSGQSISYLPPCRRLPIDAIHHFSSYHELVNPLSVTPYNSFTVKSPTDELLCDPEREVKFRCFTDLGYLFPSSLRFWDSLENFICTKLATPLSVSKQCDLSAGSPKSSDSPVTTHFETTTPEAAVAAPSLSDIFEGPPIPEQQGSSMDDGFTSGIPDDFSSGVPADFTSSNHYTFASGAPAGINFSAGERHVDPHS